MNKWFSEKKWRFCLHILFVQMKFQTFHKFPWSHKKITFSEIINSIWAMLISIISMRYVWWIFRSHISIVVNKLQCQSLHTWPSSMQYKGRRNRPIKFKDHYRSRIRPFWWQMFSGFDDKVSHYRRIIYNEFHNVSAAVICLHKINMSNATPILTKIDHDAVIAREKWKAQARL